MKINTNKNIILNLTWISFCLLVIFFGSYSPIEFVHPIIKTFFLIIIYISLPISAIWIINKAFQIKTILFTVSASVFSLFILGLIAFANTMCGTSTKVVFENREQSSTTIVSRSYGCGAWDSDLPKYTFYKVVPFAGLFNIVTKIDTTTIDKNEWKKKF